MKCVVLGDGNVGKTCLIVRYTANAFPPKYRSIVSERYMVYVDIEGKLLHLHIYDTNFQEGNEQKLPIACSDADVFVICFSLVDPSSLESVQKKWYPELRQHYPNTSFILVGTKKEQRDDLKNEESKIHKIKGQTLAQVIGASYIECSALKGDGIKDVFHEAIRVAWRSPVNRGVKHI